MREPTLKVIGGSADARGKNVPFTRTRNPSGAPAGFTLEGNRREKMCLSIDSQSQFTVVSRELNLILRFSIVPGYSRSATSDSQLLEKIEAECVYASIKAFAFVHG